MEIVASVRVPVNERVFSVSDQSLGVFIKLLAIGNTTPIKGVFVNGEVMTAEKLRRRLKLEMPEWGQVYAELTRSQLLADAGGVLFVPDARDYFLSAVYSDNVIAEVVGVIKKSPYPNAMIDLSSVLTGLGTFKRERSPESYREELKTLYRGFGDLCGKAIDYVGCFRTSKQLKGDGKLSLPRHLKIVGELFEILEAGKFKRGGALFDVTRDEIAEGLDIVGGKRKPIGLKNHNYLKVVLKNRKSQTNAKGGNGQSVSRGVSEGY